MKLTNKELSERYRENASKLANVISSLYDIMESLHTLSDMSDDEGTPYWSIQNSFPELANALAAAMIYANEYEQEASKGDRNEQ